LRCTVHGMRLNPPQRLDLFDLLMVLAAGRLAVCGAPEGRARASERAPHHLRLDRLGLVLELRAQALCQLLRDVHAVLALHAEHDPLGLQHARAHVRLCVQARALLARARQLERRAAGDRVQLCAQQEGVGLQSRREGSLIAALTLCEQQRAARACAAQGLGRKLCFPTKCSQSKPGPRASQQAGHFMTCPRAMC